MEVVRPPDGEAHNAGVDFDALARAHRDAVYRQMIRTCGNHEDAEDVLVEALLRAYQRLDQLRDPSAFRAWLTQIARRVCWRLKARESLLPLIRLSELTAAGAEPFDAAERQDDALERTRLKATLDAAVNRLTPAYRAVYVLRDLEQKSGAEVAMQLRISLAAEKSRLRRARTRIREYLDAAFAGTQAR